ncbi:MAG TPA: isoaspartyl peptidase/L-asparaginase [Candidatus Limnocylindria bacterium]|nr:isoaspartyl peptidase/L-asparaginase [Candidatus Limnocylindria bacterium]
MRILIAMVGWPLRAILAVLMLGAMSNDSRGADSTTNFVLVLHGGAGVWRNELTPEREKESRAAMRAALVAGHAILRTNGKSLDAVEAAIRILEDSPVFNAGKGSVLTAEGTVEMDASIMEGATKKAGAVASVKRIKNPITAARLVMEKSPHVMMVGEGAEKFVKEQDVKLVPPSYFITPFRKEEWERAKQKKSAKRSAEAEARDAIGTVGAVALDTRGHLAAGTSTGGMLNKKFGRVGDSPIIGAGTYANNGTCAVSCTGHGEYFIRSAVAHDVSALMEYKGLSVRAAGEQALAKVDQLGGKGGFIAMDARGNIAMPFNTDGMFRGVIRANGEITITVFRE